MSSYLITGGTGLIGTALITQLLNRQHKVIVLTRSISKHSSNIANGVHLVEKLNQIPDTQTIDFVINLAGEPIADNRWSNAQKKKLWVSRVDLTHNLISWIRRRKQSPKALISGSAIGWYGNGKAQILTETSKAHLEYTHRLCQAWENEALKLSDSNVRVCIVRTGLVIHPAGGFLAKLLPSFKLGLGAMLGPGTQYMSWIHIEDMINALLFLIDNTPNQDYDEVLEGVFNLSSPAPVTNAEFTKTLADLLQRPRFLIVPSFCLQLMLGEMSRLLTTGQRIEPQKLIRAGFKFKYSSLKEALREVLSLQRSH